MRSQNGFVLGIKSDEIGKYHRYIAVNQLYIEIQKHLTKKFKT